MIDCRGQKKNLLETTIFLSINGFHPFVSNGYKGVAMMSPDFVLSTIKRGIYNVLQMR
jgi:hypothetical protein